MNEDRTNNGRDPAQLERDIDRTRMSLGRTVDALEDRLSPGQLLDQAIGVARRHGGEFATNLGRSAENNPVPMLLAGIGIAWMMASSNEPRAAPLRHRTGAVDDAKARIGGGVRSAKSAAGAVGDRASRARDSVEDAVGHAGERVRHAGDTVRMQSDRVRQSFTNLLEEQPLVVGAIGIALGAAIGAALPRTEQEDRLMGEASDSAAHMVKDRATEAYDEVKHEAADIAGSRSEPLQERGLSGQEESVQDSSLPPGAG